MNRDAGLDFEQAINQLLLEFGYTIATRLTVQDKSAELVEMLRVLTSIASCVRQFAQARRARMASDGYGPQVDRTTLAAVRAVFEDLVDSRDDQAPADSETPTSAPAQEQSSPKQGSPAGTVIADPISGYAVTADLVNFAASTRDTRATSGQSDRTLTARPEVSKLSANLMNLSSVPAVGGSVAATDTPANCRKRGFQEPGARESP